MNKVTVPIIEYEILKAEATAYRRIIKSVQVEHYLTPPTRSRSKVLSEFKKIGKYRKEFIESLKKGLARSSYFNQK